MILTADAVPKIIILPRDSGSPLCFAFRLRRRTLRVRNPVHITRIKKEPILAERLIFYLAEKEGYGALSVYAGGSEPLAAKPSCSRLHSSKMLSRILDCFDEPRGFSPPCKTKKPPVWVVFCFGGEGGIRTLEPLLMVTRFPIVRARPTTRLLQTCVSVYKALDYYNSYCHKNQVFF